MKCFIVIISLLLITTNIPSYSQINYKPCIRSDVKVSKETILNYVKDFYSYEQDSGNWSKSFDLLHPALAVYQSFIKNQYETARKSGATPLNEVSELYTVGYLYQRDNKEYFKVTFKRGYYIDKYKLLFIRNRGEEHWKILPYHYPLDDKIFTYESSDVFIDVEEISGYYCESKKVELEKIGEYVFNACKKNTFEDAYCMMGLTHRVIAIAFKESMDKGQTKHINNLIDKKEVFMMVLIQYFLTRG